MSIISYAQQQLGTSFFRIDILDRYLYIWVLSNRFYKPRIMVLFCKWKSFGFLHYNSLFVDSLHWHVSTMELSFLLEIYSNVPKPSGGETEDKGSVEEEWFLHVKDPQINVQEKGGSSTYSWVDKSSGESPNFAYNYVAIHGNIQLWKRDLG